MKKRLQRNVYVQHCVQKILLTTYAMFEKMTSQIA